MKNLNKKDYVCVVGGNSFMDKFKAIVNKFFKHQTIEHRYLTVNNLTKYLNSKD